jgi:peptidoglycan/LPS O-acetylase OafA/YrhL
VLAVFAQHLGDAHLAFVRGRVEASVPAALAPWIMTVLHHAHWGVDLFFVLSGFSLAQPLLARLAAGGPGAAEPLRSRAERAAFFRRRAARIYPAYAAALALVIASVPAVRAHHSFAASLAAHLALVQGYVTPGGLAIIGAAWSLSTEASFYVAWPWLAPGLLAPARAGVTARRNPWFFGVAVVVVVWLVRAALHEIALSPGAPEWLLEATQRRWAVSRLDQFALGALAAALRARAMRSALAPRLVRLAPVIAVLCALALVPAFYLEGALYREPLGAWPYALVSLATAGLVLAAGCAGESAARWLFSRPLRAVGVVSYGVFLNHQLALGAAAHVAGPAGSWGALGSHAALALALSLALGWLSWVVIERPVIEWAARKTRPAR